MEHTKGGLMAMIIPLMPVDSIEVSTMENPDLARMRRKLAGS